MTDVEFSPSRATTIDCTLPLTVYADITTDSKATVVYHWESSVTSDSSPVTISFPSAGTRSVRTTVRPNASGVRPTFTETLVIDEPNSTRTNRDYTCR